MQANVRIRYVGRLAGMGACRNHRLNLSAQWGSRKAHSQDPINVVRQRELALIGLNVELFPGEKEKGNHDYQTVKYNFSNMSPFKMNVFKFPYEVHIRFAK